MSDPVEKYDEYYTYADYLKWETAAQYELMDGQAYMMASPSADHQRISGALF
jgi:Uma2 family endonuclease